MCKLQKVQKLFEKIEGKNISAILNHALGNNKILKMKTLLKGNFVAYCIREKREQKF